MASERPNQTVVDYVTIVLSPVLIMGLVGSLAFFLLEIFYKTDGQWRERLQWILFFFVFGMVFVARISMNGETASRAPLYGLILGFATYLGMQAFIEYPPGIKSMSFLVNVFLIAVVWWCTNRLVWDCTNVDEDTDMSGEGLMQASGIEGKPELKNPLEDDDEPELLQEEHQAPRGWWERYQKYREHKNKKRTLGTWVVYFSLAALPIFGLGQALIPLTAPARRQFSFWLMMIYVGCGLGLLLTTCFLGLRRYLRQKRLQMPAAMTVTWMVMGGSLLAALLLIGALLPRPAAEYSPLSEWITPGGSTKRKASRHAVKGDSPGEGQGRASKSGKRGQQSNQTGEKGKGTAPGKNGKRSGEGEKGQSRGQNDRQDGKGQGENNKSQRGDTEEKSGDPQKGDDQQKDGGDQNREQNREQNRSGRQSQSSGKDEKNDNDSDQESQEQAGSTPSSSPPNAVQQVMQRVAPILKWIVFAVMVFLVIVALLRAGLGFLANFSDWAKNLLASWRNFWANLFGQRPAEASEEDEDEEERESERWQPFRAFDNPFESGQATRMSPRRLVRYTFRAVEAWARERDLPRENAETAMEFLKRIGEEVPAMEAEARRLAELHARAEYAPGGLPTSTSEQLRLFWEKLESVASSPLSA